MEKLTLSKRPRTLPATVTRYRTGCGSVYVTVSVDEDGTPLELFANMGKTGGCSMAMLEAVGKSVSVGLRCGVDPKEYIEKLVGIACPSQSWDNGEHIMSCIDAMGRELRDVLERRKLRIDKEPIDKEPTEEEIAARVEKLRAERSGED